MPAKLASASIDLGVRPQHQPKGVERQPDQFPIVLLGDFTGRTNRGVVEPLAGRKLHRVDCDNLERVFAQLGAGLKLSAGPTPESVELQFSTLDDFHPDKLLPRVGQLAKLFEARRLLLKPATAEQGKAELQAFLGAAIGGQAGSTASSGPAQAESDRDTLGRLLGGSKPGPKPESRPLSAADQLIRQIVSPHVAPGSAAWQQGALSAADLELAKRLRALLHHSDFQALEAAWRGVDFLLRRIEAVEEVPVHLLDISPAELQADLLAPSSIEQSQLLRALRERGAALLVGDFAFGKTADDLRALGRLAEIAAALGAPFIATADPQLVGCDAFGSHPDPDDWKTGLAPEVDAAWRALRASPPANFVGLAAPRFVARQPYGKSGEAIESFPFEELPGEPAHENFLWGHPGVLCASVLVETFQSALAVEAGAFAPSGGEVGDLPAHKFTADGETVVKPYAEAWLTDRAAERMIAGGIIPLLSRKDYNGVQVPGFPSVSSPPRALAIGGG